MFELVKASVFGTENPIHPCLIFVGKTGDYQTGASHEITPQGKAHNPCLHIKD
jgi:hypothetical protein